MYTIELDLLELIALRVAASDKAEYYSQQMVKAIERGSEDHKRTWHDSLKPLYCAMSKLDKA